jgi:membrane protease subunit HflK
MNRKERTVLVTITINLLLIAFKLWLAGASGSLSLRASALHSIADAAIGAFVLIGLVISRWNNAQNTRKNQVNVIENWVALAVALAIFYVGFDIIIEVLGGQSPELKNLGPIALASLVTVAAAYFIARYKLYVGRQTNSPALIAGGYHSQMDIYASIVVVAGLAGAALGLPNLDRAAAAVVVVFILFSGYEIASSAISALRHHETLDIEGETGETHKHAPAPSGLWRAFLPVSALILVAFYLLSGFYIVQAGEAAVVRRFGSVIAGNVGPGLHYRLPWPMDRVDLIALDAVRRAETPTSLMLTGDENLINVRLAIHYTVTNPVKFILNVVAPEMLVQQAADSAMRQVVANEAVDGLLTVDKAAIQQKATVLAQSVLDGYDSGLKVIGVQLLESSPPPEVADAFRDVSSAREDRNTFINEALAYQNEILPVARGDAERIIQQANAYRSEKTALATGDAAQFASQQAAYAQASDITRLRMYLEAVEKVLPGVRKFVLDAAVKIESTDLWFPGLGSSQVFPQQP